MTMPVPPHAAARIAAHMRTAADRGPASRIGPFTVGLDRYSDDPMRNFAVPDDGSCPTAEDVRDLIDAFRERGRIPRLEYVEASSPGVEPALVAAGFTVERRTPVMISVPGIELTPREPGGITVREAAGDADLAAAVAVQHHAYELPEPGPDDRERLARLADRGGVISVAVSRAGSGEVVGTGLVDVTGLGGTGELAAVGVRAAFRGRGIASALSAHLARMAHGRGIGLVFLEAEPEEVRIYRRTGFIDVTTKIWISRR